MNENVTKLSCSHGRLRRSCEQCTVEKERDELRSALDAANREVDRLREGIQELSSWWAQSSKQWHGEFYDSGPVEQFLEQLAALLDPPKELIVDKCPKCKSDFRSLGLMRYPDEGNRQAETYDFACGSFYELVGDEWEFRRTADCEILGLRTALDAANKENAALTAEVERLKGEDARMSKSLSMDALESDVAALLAKPEGAK